MLGLLVSPGADPRDAVRAVGDRGRQVREHPSRVVQPRALVSVGQYLAHPTGQTGQIGHLAQQPDAGVRDHAVAVRADLDPRNHRDSLHLESASLVRMSEPSASPIIRYETGTFAYQPVVSTRIRHSSVNNPG